MLALTILVARVSSPSTFGAFALAFGVLPVAITVMRSLASDPMAITHGREDASADGPDVTGIAVVFGTLVGAPLLVGAAVAKGSLSSLLVIVAISLPGILLQDAARAALLILGRPADASVNNLLRLILHLGASALLIATDADTAISFGIVWGAASGLGGVVGVRQLGTRPALNGSRLWLRRHRELWPSLLAEQFVMTGTWQLALIGLAAIAGVASTAGIRGAQTIFGPVTMLHLALPFTVVPILGRRFHMADGPAAGIRLMVFISSSLIVGALVLTGLLLALPDSVGKQVLGESWESTRSVLVPFGVYLAGTGATQAALLGLRALAAVKKTVRIRFLSGATLLAGTAIGARLGQSGGFVVGLAASTWLVALVWWTVFNSEMAAHLASTKDDRHQ